MPTALNRISTAYSAHARCPRSNQPCAAMIATAAAGKMIALPKRANRSAAISPPNIGPGVRRRADQRDGRGEQQRDREPADERRAAPPGEGGDHHQDDRRRSIRISSGRMRREAVHQCAASMVACALRLRLAGGQLRIAGRSDALDRARAAGRRRRGSAAGSSRDRRPSRRRRARDRAEQPPFARLTGRASPPRRRCAASPKQIRQ